MDKRKRTTRSSIEVLVSSSVLVRRSARLVFQSRLLSRRKAPIVEVRVRDIGARCSCGVGGFYAPGRAPWDRGALFVCAACGEQASYGKLLDRIGEEALRRARESLEGLRPTRVPEGKPSSVDPAIA
jgi:hypothetical protein